MNKKRNIRKRDQMLSLEVPRVESELRHAGNATSCFTIPVIISVRKIYTLVPKVYRIQNLYLKFL
jgi:hypothetical protein